TGCCAIGEWKRVFGISPSRNESSRTPRTRRPHEPRCSLSPYPLLSLARLVYSCLPSPGRDFVLLSIAFCTGSYSLSPKRSSRFQHRSVTAVTPSPRLRGEGIGCG